MSFNGELTMNFQTRFIGSLLFILLVILFISIQKKHTDSELLNADGDCFFKKKYQVTRINGFVTKKFNDKRMHLSPALTLDDNLTYHFNKELSGFYELIKIGDYLEKPIGSLTITIFRDSSIFKKTLDFYGCENGE